MDYPIQNYMVINEDTNIVVNMVVWDGNTEWWLPPKDCFAIPQDSTPCKTWVPVKGPGDKMTYEMEAQIGGGQIGYKWDGEYVVTNTSQPSE